MKRILFVTVTFLMITGIYSQKAINKIKTGVRVELKDDIKPEVYVHLIDNRLIENITIIKGNKTKEYFENPKGFSGNPISSITLVEKEDERNIYNSPNGVILITTRKILQGVEIKNSKSTGKKGDKKTTTGNTNKNLLNPLIIIDGKKSDKETLDGLDHEKIKTISILKGESAKEYDAPNGVILVITKKN
jgi:hypothetical protein